MRSKSKVMTKREATEALRASGEISTNMLSPLNISMDLWLMYAQMSKSDRVETVRRLLLRLDQILQREESAS